MVDRAFHPNRLHKREPRNPEHSKNVEFTMSRARYLPIPLAGISPEGDWRSIKESHDTEEGGGSPFTLTIEVGIIFLGGATRAANAMIRQDARARHRAD